MQTHTEMDKQPRNNACSTIYSTGLEIKSDPIIYRRLTGAFSALTLSVGQLEGHLACKKTERWGASAVICLERGADLHTAQLMPLPLSLLLQ